MKLLIPSTWLSIVLLASSLSAQKVNIGYDKGVDFHKFTTYSWGEPERSPTRPMLYQSIIASVDYELKAKGLRNVDSKADLILIPAGGMEYGFNIAAGTPILPTRGGPPPVVDATMWTGAGGSSALTAPSVSEGSLMLTFIDQAANKVVWTGTVRQKLDMENKKKSLQLIDKAITKLLAQFPPVKK